MDKMAWMWVCTGLLNAHAEIHTATWWKSGMWKKHITRNHKHRPTKWKEKKKRSDRRKSNRHTRRGNKMEREKKRKENSYAEKSTSDEEVQGVLHDSCLFTNVLVATWSFLTVTDGLLLGCSCADSSSSSSSSNGFEPTGSVLRGTARLTTWKETGWWHTHTPTDRPHFSDTQVRHGEPLSMGGLLGWALWHRQGRGPITWHMSATEHNLDQWQHRMAAMLESLCDNAFKSTNEG